MTKDIQPIRKLLVANRGEIALRIMRTAKEMGIKTVAICSDIDALSPHSRFADEVRVIGPASSNKSYLHIDRVLEAARDTGADAIHPGYGFLSENAEFAAQVEAAGLKFVGPPPSAIETMGSKLAAKDAVMNHDVPLVPGTAHAVIDPDEAMRESERIGFPLLIKASAGGGGKGMRIVERPEEMAQAFDRAISEAVNAFGDGSVFMERFVNSPRHIEVQILADSHGNVVHLFERECSIQRRHQKVVEEAPSAVLTPELRNAMGECAIAVAKSCNYIGAGTVEFLLDNELSFYFLEMNTRLQVEHPVTECITGIDLVREQIRIAEGHPLSFRQEDLRIQGHAIELRVYAEDARAGFLPATGTLRRYRKPVGPGIRVDDGVEEGAQVTIHYDPMLAKLVVHGPDRSSAIDRAIRAIDTYEIHGVPTTLDFGRVAIDHEAFRSGQFDTLFVQKHFNPLLLDGDLDLDEFTLAQLGMELVRRETAPNATQVTESPAPSRWKLRGRSID